MVYYWCIQYIYIHIKIPTYSNYTNITLVAEAKFEVI